MLEPVSLAAAAIKRKSLKNFFIPKNAIQDIIRLPKIKQASKLTETMRNKIISGKFSFREPSCGDPALMTDFMKARF